MKLKFIMPKAPEPIYKSSVHRSGRIGFTIEAADIFGISANKTMSLGINSEDEDDKNIYGILSTSDDKHGYKIQKAGNYHSVKANGFFDTLNIEYASGDLSYNVTESTIDGAKILKFSPNPRKVAKSKKVTINT